MKYIMGVDPGLTGAIALLEVDPNCDIVDVQVWDMPVDKVGKTLRNRMNLPRLAELIEPFAKETAFALIEEVGVMGGEGTISMFSFGYAAGSVAGVIGGNFIPFKLVKPSVWKVEMGLGREKQTSRDRATKLFPRFSDKWRLVKDHGRAEAVLLAWYGYQAWRKGSASNSTKV